MTWSATRMAGERVSSRNVNTLISNPPYLRVLEGLLSTLFSGGLIGYNCSHAYPHTTKTKLNFLAPDNLKGADMLMYEIFKSLGLTVRFRHVVSDRGVEGDRELPVVGLDSEWKVFPMEVEDSVEVFDRWSGRGRDGRHEDEGQYVDFLDVHWLNDWGHQEQQFTWITVSDDTQLKGSMVAADPPVS